MSGREYSPCDPGEQNQVFWIFFGAYLRTVGPGAAGKRRATRSEETEAAPSSVPAGSSLWS